MKTLILSIVILFSAGCATVGSLPASPIAGGPSAAGTMESSPAQDESPLEQATDMSPRIVIPATGGAPIIGIPLGGNIFLPVTGGTPVIGIPTSP